MTPSNLLDFTRELIAIRKKPSTEERFKSYPSLLQGFKTQLDLCDDAVILSEVLRLDSGYFLLAGYRQEVLEKLLALQRTPQVLRMYALQLELFGDVDAYGQANTETDARVEALYAEADALEQGH